MLNVLLSDLAAFILMKLSIIVRWTYLHDTSNLSISEISSVIHSIHNVPDKIPR